MVKQKDKGFLSDNQADSISSHETKSDSNKDLEFRSWAGSTFDRGLSHIILSKEPVSKLDLALHLCEVLYRWESRTAPKEHVEEIDRRVAELEARIETLHYKPEIVFTHFAHGIIEAESSKLHSGSSETKINRVIKALSDTRWDFRTVNGLAKETGLKESEVRTILESESELVRKSVVPDKNGNDLYTLRSRPVKLRERLAELWLYLNKYF